MQIVWAMLVGLVVGALAKFLMPGKDPGGFVITSLIGIGGAALASFIGSHVGWYAHGDVPGLVASVGGAMLLLLAYRFTFGRKRLSA